MERIIRKNNKFEILTPTGWSDFDGISCSITPSTIMLVTKNHQLECTPEHILKTIGLFPENDGFQYVNKLIIGDSIFTKSGLEVIQDIIIINEENKVYEPLEVKNDHVYYSNEIISHNCSFLGSSGTLISGWKLRELVGVIPMFIHEGLTKYIDPIKDHRYVITADVSEGKGLDYSTFHVTDVTIMPYKQCCVYRSNQSSPHEFAQMIHQAAMIYNDAIVLIEYANLGPLVSDILFNDFEYENLLSTEASKERGREISSGTKMSNQVEKGLRITPLVKRMSCSLLKLLVEQNQLIIYNQDTIDELNRYSKVGTSYAAEEGWHDDLVASLLVFAWLSSQDYFKNYTDINTMAKLRDDEYNGMADTLVPFGFHNTNDNDNLILNDMRNNDLVLQNLFNEIMKKADPKDREEKDPDKPLLNF